MPSYTPLLGGIWLLSLFFPIDYALVCLAIWLAAEAFAGCITLVFGFVVRVVTK